MEIIVTAAILDFNRKWIFFRLPPYLKLKILLKTMFVPSFMLVPQKAVFFDILQLSAGLYGLLDVEENDLSRHHGNDHGKPKINGQIFYNTNTWL